MRIFLIVLASLLAFALIVFLALFVASRPRKDRKYRKAFESLESARYAHRGLFDPSIGIYENTYKAFERAAERGFGIELDVHITTDGRAVVMHDDSLKRTCGKDIRISDSSYSDIEDIKVGESDPIPLFDKVLELIDKRVPLIIELKSDRTDISRLCSTVCKCLENYDGEYCVESFDPRVVLWFKKNRPEIIRGQLAANFTKDSKVANPILRFLSRSLLICIGSKPDFIAYDVKSVAPLAKLYFTLWRPHRFVWTVKDENTLKTYEEKGIASIFEGFIPE